MNRREFLRGALSSPLIARVVPASRSQNTKRCRPSDAEWPSEMLWKRLEARLTGSLIRLQPQSDTCETLHPPDCGNSLAELRNPFFVGDQPALTQTTGWLNAWRSKPSVYAVAAANSEDVAAAVNFARVNNLRLVVRGGGHSYQGTSQAPDSLMIWTRRMNEAKVHAEFTARDCEALQAPQPAVTLGAGAMWIDAYDAVTTRAGRYVQGGGCATVGVAGLVQSGGFNMFSKRYGLAAAGLLEAEVVTADGRIRVVNAKRDPDLFWALKGGGGGSFGVVTRVTLRTRDLPTMFGLMSCSIVAPSDDSFRALIRRAMNFYRTHLFNPSWGEKINLLPGRILNVNMFAQGLTLEEINSVWKPFFDWVRANGYIFSNPPRVLMIPARSLWDRDYMTREFPGALVPDDRPHAPYHHARFADDDGEVGWFINGYQSTWLPAALLADSQLDILTQALFAAARIWPVQLFLSKGLAGAPQAEITAARDTAINPGALDAFALAIIADGGAPQLNGVSAVGSENGRSGHPSGPVATAMQQLKKIAPSTGSYVAESDYFLTNWQQEFWGQNYRRLLAVKSRYDPSGLFFVRHGVGSELWSEDGFTRIRTS